MAAPAAAQDEKLQALRSRIEQLTKDVQKSEAARKEARDALRDSERAISEANRTLAALQAEGVQLRREAGRIAERRRVVERSLAERQAAVERMLMARQAGGAPDALRVALSGDDPGSLGRTLHYLGQVSRAAAAVLGAYRAGLDEREGLARDAQAKRERHRVFDRLAGEIRKSRREIGVLRADEARLGRLVEEIGRVLARVEIVPERDTGKDPFSSLRGKLRLPVRGELSGRFGTTRGAAGSEAKGVFIRAPQGQPVRAVGRGQVVYADWMRGFGNLMIVDHGENYLSIYANNESLLKLVGDAVAAGEPISTTGSSGGNEETGLYFELRHLGRAFDPLRWVRLR